MIFSCFAVAGMSVQAAGDTNTIYFDNTKAGYSTPKIYLWNSSNSAYKTWPGESMTKVEGNIWKYEAPVGYTNVIFNNGSGLQTGDQTLPGDSYIFVSSSTTAGSWYQAATDPATTTTAAPTTEPEIEPPTGTFTVYFDNSEYNYATPTAYVWNETNGMILAEWPGTAMNQVSENVYSFSAILAYDKIIFNDGKNVGAQQTDNLDVENGKIYKKDKGWQDYNPNETDPVVETTVPVPVTKEYYLVGYINGADYGIESDIDSFGDYKFVDGKVTVTFTETSYVIVKDSDKVLYMTNGFATEVPVELKKQSELGENADKLMVPAGTYDFTLTAGENDTFTLSYVRKGAPEIKGDTNGDYVVNIKDATYIQKAIAGLVDLDLSVGDLDGNGVIDINDVTLLQKYLAKLVDESALKNPPQGESEFF